jgi:type I restriction enzyme, R subunit
MQNLRHHWRRDAKAVTDQIRSIQGILTDAGPQREFGSDRGEVSFDDALGVSDIAVSVLGDEALRTIVQELVRFVRQNATIDWTVRESARASLRSMIKRLLRRYGYPHDKQEQATKTVLEQAELLCADWAA